MASKKQPAALAAPVAPVADATPETVQATPAVETTPQIDYKPVAGDFAEQMMIAIRKVHGESDAYYATVDAFVQDLAITMGDLIGYMYTNPALVLTNCVGLAAAAAKSRSENAGADVAQQPEGQLPS